MKQGKLVTVEERERMRALRRQGLSAAACGRVVGRNGYTAWRHTRDVCPRREPEPGSVERALRLERLFAACNRAITEASR